MRATRDEKADEIEQQARDEYQRANWWKAGLSILGAVALLMLFLVKVDLRSLPTWLQLVIVIPSAFLFIHLVSWWRWGEDDAVTDALKARINEPERR